MKIKGKTIEQLKKAEKRLKKTNPIKAGYVKNRINKLYLLSGIQF